MKPNEQMTETQQKLRALIEAVKHDPKLKAKVKHHVKELGMDTKSPAVFRQTLKVTPSNLVRLNSRIGKLGDHITSLMVVTDTTLTHVQIAKALKIIESHGWQVIHGASNSNNVTYFKK